MYYIYTYYFRNIVYNHQTNLQIDQTKLETTSEMSMSHRPATPRGPMEFPADVEMEMDDSHLPKSSSSAMPDLQAATVPRLKAKVHRLTPERLKQISLSDLDPRSFQ